MSFQMMRDLSLDDDRIMWGYLGLVMITQPLWPRSCRVSVILPLLSFSARFKRVSQGVNLAKTVLAKPRAILHLT